MFGYIGHSTRSRFEMKKLEENRRMFQLAYRHNISYRVSVSDILQWNTARSITAKSDAAYGTVWMGWLSSGHGARASLCWSNKAIFDAVLAALLYRVHCTIGMFEHLFGGFVVPAKGHRANAERHRITGKSSAHQHPLMQFVHNRLGRRFICVRK